MREIKFSNNWNKKLNCDYFTTIRIYTKEKFDYYYGLYENKEEVVISIKEEEICSAKIVDINVKMLKDIPDFTCITDIGADRITFDTIMDSIYRKKPEWNHNFTRMIILWAVKLERGKYTSFS